MHYPTNKIYEWNIYKAYTYQSVAQYIDEFSNQWSKMGYKMVKLSFRRSQHIIHDDNGRICDFVYMNKYYIYFASLVKMYGEKEKNGK